MEASPKITPDSGVHIDAGLLSTEESVQPQSTQEFDGGVTNETDEASTSSSDDSRQQPRRAWSVTREASSHVHTRAASTQTHRPNQHIISPKYVLDRPELTVTDVTSSDDQSSREGATGGQMSRRGKYVRLYTV